MIAECCCEGVAIDGAVACPRSGGAARLVPWRTVAALVVGAVPPLEQFRLCPDAGCDVVYFGSGGTVYRAADVRALPAWKSGSASVLCHCFELDRETLEAEVRAHGASPSVAAIREATAAGRCACEIRNPAGRCCLGDLEAAVRAARERSER